MTRVLVLYYSSYGHVRALAEAVVPVRSTKRRAKLRGLMPARSARSATVTCTCRFSVSHCSIPSKRSLASICMTSAADSRLWLDPRRIGRRPALAMAKDIARPQSRSSTSSVNSTAGIDPAVVTIGPSSTQRGSGSNSTSGNSALKTSAATEWIVARRPRSRPSRPRIAHEVLNETGEPTRFLAITAPAVAGDREEIGSPAENTSASAAPVLIRPAKASDRGALHVLFTDSWLTFWAPHLPREAEARFRAEDPVARFLDASLDRIKVAGLGPDIVGAILVEDDCLEDLHVARSFQRRGIGLRLLRHAEALGARRLEVRAFNERAIRFYERAGWMRRRTYPTTEMGFPTLSHEYVAPLK